MSKLPFDFYFEDVDFDLKFKNEIASWLNKIASDENKSIQLLEYIFCSDSYLLDINKTHLNHDFYTDIITFPLNNDPLEATIFISIDRVVENAKTFKDSFENELHRVMVHGLLHLIGYNDKTEQEKEEMRSMENKALSERSFI
ncbi:MAG: rRNA maturation RNase YbeY [Saprospiraceae bacterium]|nr:rRNA maturation RNase YbeY [Bacteroidia bacterium]NNE16663.1 rRNA maturation RNase YbeY [Saprospiraceae bacterium]NNL92358.1 rRNA maturation RNase YbeY [Saprospiraceae bacterium]